MAQFYRLGTKPYKNKPCWTQNEQTIQTEYNNNNIKVYVGKSHYLTRAYDPKLARACNMGMTYLFYKAFGSLFIKYGAWTCV